MLHRRRILAAGAAAVAAALPFRAGWTAQPGFAAAAEDLTAWLTARSGGWDDTLYRQLLGAANEWKEGDAIIGVAARDADQRLLARRLLAETPLGTIDQHPPYTDELLSFILGPIDRSKQSEIATWTLGQLRDYLLSASEDQIKSLLPGLTSDVIACVVRLMDNQQLIQLGSSLFHPLPGTHLGARGYLGARVQPNSPTDNVDDIRWQVFNAFAWAVGDVLLGTNPVSSDPESVADVQRTLQDITRVFGIEEVLPHCVLAHIDVQAEVERRHPGLTALWFQSIAGNTAANATFGISTESMRQHAAARTGKFGLYFETGQGADFTNGHGYGVDMVIHEARKYGFARALTAVVRQTLAESKSPHQPWVHLNDVAGFIGPEVFRTREQLVRCCLEDIAMGKLHGLTIGLDICSTLHMDVSLDDLGWCIEQVMPANPAYLMALPTRIDPMLGYLTTGFHDHVAIREQFGLKVDDRMWAFFQSLGVIDGEGRPTEHFGDPAWVFLQYLRRRGDQRSNAAILEEARLRMAEVRSRGVFLADGTGDRPSELRPELNRELHRIYTDARVSIWKELDPNLAQSIPGAVVLNTRSADRVDYILHPTSGEQLSEASARQLEELLRGRGASENLQLVVSDGLNALALTDRDQLQQLLRSLRPALVAAGFRPAPEVLLVHAGRVRAGYRIGEQLFGGRDGAYSLLHIVGERPGTGHHTLSIYMTRASGAVWGQPGRIDHNLTRVVSGIAVTALIPELGAAEAVRILSEMPVVES
ncbi:MAG: Ethanolamine ammonia-lyase heavy chain [Planctomycetota bacterium]|jgi:ethanolamine ammonia-lyase large subunit